VSIPNAQFPYPSIATALYYLFSSHDLRSSDTAEFPRR